MKVKVYSTQMGEKEIETSATTWGELQSDLRNNQVSFNKMKAVIGENKLTLEADGAMLPPQGFTLFLMNKKTKAGLGKKSFATYKYGELRGTVRFILNQDPSQADYFNVGKNYTTKSTDTLKSLLENYGGVVPSIKDVSEFIAAAKANKGKAKVAPKKVAKVEEKVEAKTPKKEIVIKKNEVEEPKRGFGAEADIPKKKSEVITKAQEVVESVKKEKESTENIQHAEVVAVDAIIKALEDIKFPKGKRIKKLRAKAFDILATLSTETELALILIEEKRLAKEAEEKAKAEAKAEEDRLAKEKADAEAKIAQEKEEKENALKAQMSDLMGEFSDVRGY